MSRTVSFTRHTCLALVLTIAIVGHASAQVTTGSVAGSVKDQQGAVIPGATVLLTSQSKGTKLSPVVTSGAGDFQFVNVAPDTYTVEVTMPSFVTARRSDVAVSPGDRVTVPAIVLTVGGTAETVDVKAQSVMVQANSGERSFTVATEAVQNLPIANRSFTALTSLTPGVSGNDRIGGGGDNNVMIDGVSAVATGSNAIFLQINIEAIAEVKVLTSGYQAEYGRSSGLQVTAVTKSGTNRFRGSLYDVERNSSWNANSRTNILNGDAKPLVRERDWGYSIGGPIGKPGGNNKLFFFQSTEFAPRQQGGGINRFRVPTQAERNGDFSATVDNNGALFTSIRNPFTGVLSPTVPQSAFYGLGQAILNQYPLPTIDAATALAQRLNYNYEFQSPKETLTAWQPVVRVDYQPHSSLRLTARYSGWRQNDKVFLGTLPAQAPGWVNGATAGLTESRQTKPVVFNDSFTVNWTINPTTFLEGTYGHSSSDLSGCALAQGGTGPTFCNAGVPVAAASSRVESGLDGLPTLFPRTSFTLNPEYYAYNTLSRLQPPMFVNGQVLKTPNFTWGGRVANSPPNSPFAGFLTNLRTDDFSVSLTHVRGRHTFKGGFYSTHSFKQQQQNSNATFGTLNFTNNANNPLDSGHPYSNALYGVVNSFNQLSTYIEGLYVYYNIEGFIQDNWKVSGRLTLDYGIRLVHQQPQYDKLGQASNFLPETYTGANAPLLYRPGCAGGATTCTGNNRQAVDPRTPGVTLGAGSSVYIGTLVPNTGDTTNGLFVSGQGIADTTYVWPSMGYAPRFGAAYDLHDNQKVVLRGGAGIYFDRPSGNTVFAQVTNPPAVKNITLNFADLRNIDASKAVQAAPALNVFTYETDLPTSAQWNGGVQMSLPWATTLDVSYVGQHAWNQLQSINLNSIDLGSAFSSRYDDPTNSTDTPATSLVAVNVDLTRPFQGYGSISQQNPRGWNTYHSLQFSMQRRFNNGFAFGFNDTWSLSNRSQTAPRLQHNPDGTYTYRSDQAEADALLQTKPVAHTMKANFIVSLPKMSGQSAVTKAVAAIVNDWQLSGIWTATTGSWYSANATYQNGGGNVNLTGSPDFSPRVVVVGDTGSGCNRDDLLRQFNIAAFQGPAVGSVGLESGPSVAQGCFQHALDLAIQRTIRLGGTRTLQLRVDMFNAPNMAIITGRNTTMNLTSPADPVTITNLPDQATGARTLPRNAGYGVATNFQNPRSVQIQVRYAF